MSKQIFKNNVPNKILFDLLDNICEKNETFYTFNVISFKKGLYNNYIQSFITECTQYYHSSKLKYLEKGEHYTSFLTILRQICNFNNINYNSHIKYNKSKYEIVYFIFF